MEYINDTAQMPKDWLLFQGTPAVVYTLYPMNPDYVAWFRARKKEEERLRNLAKAQKPKQKHRKKSRNKNKLDVNNNNMFKFYELYIRETIA